MRLIFSRDRAAQLDLLLRSLQRFAPHEQTTVIWDASDIEFVRAYEQLPLSVDGYAFGIDFNHRLRQALWTCPDQTVTFFCDDDVMFDDAPAPDLLTRLGTYSDQVLTHSLRLGKKNPMWEQVGYAAWGWYELPRTDFGFPGSIDGHTFRIKDVQFLIGDEHIPNPTMLETVLAMRCEALAEDRPMMLCEEKQTVVGVPVNRVSENSGVPAGERYPQPTKELNDRFLAGERIDLAAVMHDTSDVKACHQEIQFQWEVRP